jgi:hypothetical protein
MVDFLVFGRGITPESSQQRPSVGEHDLVELLAVERRLE